MCVYRVLLKPLTAFDYSISNNIIIRISFLLYRISSLVVTNNSIQFLYILHSKILTYTYHPSFPGLFIIWKSITNVVVYLIERHLAIWRTADSQSNHTCITVKYTYNINICILICSK